MLTQKMIDFILYLEKARLKYDYSSILSCDETAVYLDWSKSLTVETKGAKQVRKDFKTKLITVMTSGICSNHRA